MELYNRIIKGINNLLSNKNPRSWSYNKDQAWEDIGVSELILKRDEAFELGGVNHAVNLTCVTSDEDLVSRDEIFLYGPDLNEIKNDCSFARIAFLSVSEMEGDEQTYKAIREIEFVKYHVFPKGYMIRMSPENYREQVRVSKETIKKGISFESIGNAFINKYKEDSHIKNVRIIFITDETCNFNELENNAQEIYKITKALDHVMDGVATDCASCNLKEICDEVEGMRELHFKVNASHK